MQRNFLIILCLVVFFIAATASVLWHMPGSGLELTVTPVSEKDSRPILVLALKPDENFTIHYYHSVENAPIWEKHYVDKNGKLFIEEEKYLKFGAGMGKMPGIGTMVKQGRFEVIKNMHMATGDFILRIGSQGVDHTVLWRGTRTNLSEKYAHVPVRFSASRKNLGYWLWRSFFPHPATPRGKISE